jgi:hypothetical protein
MRPERTFLRKSSIIDYKADFTRIRQTAITEKMPKYFATKEEIAHGVFEN